MKIIYVMENIKNGKKYVGQTNDFLKRMNAHKSDASNPNSHSYNYPLSNAIRKYGWKSFKNYIVEEIPDKENYKTIDEREKFFINYYHSLVSENGYNIAIGGQGCPKPEKTYEEKINSSSLFSAKEVKEIQQELINGTPTCIILEKYSLLTGSYLSNINSGLNFRNEEFTYPLHRYEEDISHMRSISEIHKIKKDIIDGISYSDISNKWNISNGMISLVNNGKQWNEKEYSYPLSIRSHSRLQNAMTWVKDVQNDLIHTHLKLVDIAAKYNKGISTIKKINSGNSHRNKEYKYPLTSNRT